MFGVGCSTIHSASFNELSGRKSSTAWDQGITFASLHYGLSVPLVFSKSEIADTSYRDELAVKIHELSLILFFLFVIQEHSIKQHFSRGLS